MALSDVTMTDAWKTYRQELRDITKQTPTDIRLSNIKFPEKPTE
jgi:IS1 family transposase